MTETRRVKAPAPTSRLPCASDVEQKFAKLEQRFAQLKAEVRQAQQLAGMGTAACSIAHEFSNLLSPVLSYARYALGTDDIELHKKALDITVKNVRLLVEMADRTLELSAAKPVSREAVVLSQAVEDGAASLCRGFEKDGITFRNDIDPALTVWTDPLHMQQVFFNLFLNARDAMAPSKCGLLKVSAERREDDVVIRVKDTGPGIDPDVLDHIFDSFLTTKASKQNGRQRCGGLGLALCKDLIEESGGTIGVESTSGEGTVFTVTLPAEKLDSD